MRIENIEKQIKETEGDPFADTMIVYAYRLLAVLSVLVLFFVVSDRSWFHLLIIGIAVVIIFSAGYLDAKQLYQGRLYIASLNLQRMTRNLLGQRD